jgi:hypothetical protein
LEYLLTILYAALFILLIYRIRFFQTDGISRKAIALFFLVKVITGILLSLIYTYYYTDRTTADIFKYFDDSKIMYDALFHKPADFFRMLFGINNDTPYFSKNYYDVMNNWYRPYEPNVYNDNHTIIRFNAAIRLVSFGYYNVHTVFMCFLSTAGIVALFKTFFPYMEEKRKELGVLLFLTPSVLFWCSGVLKEGILMLGLGFLLLSFSKLVKKGFNWKSLIVFIFALLILAYLKYYILTILIPLLIAFFWVEKTSGKYVLLKYFLVIFVFYTIIFNIHRVLPNYNVLEILAQKQNSFVYLAEKIKAGSLTDNELLQPSLFDFLVKAPKAFYTVFFRPFIFELSSPLMFPAAIENLCILLLMVIAAFFFKLKKEHSNIVAFCISFVAITFILTGLTTPVLGAIVRYKVPALPFLFITAFLIMDKSKLMNKFKFLKFLK